MTVLSTHALETAIRFASNGLALTEEERIAALLELSELRRAAGAETPTATSGSTDAALDKLAAKHWKLARYSGRDGQDFDHRAFARELLAGTAAPADERPQVSVWFGSMPESNGKKNWTAILHSGDISEGYTIDRSEYHDRVRYAADCVRHIIGELPERPFIVHYDANLLSPAGT